MGNNKDIRIVLSTLRYKSAPELSSALQIPLVQSIREAGDAGRPAVLQETTPQALAFREMAQNIAQQIAILNANKVKETVATA